VLTIGEFARASRLSPKALRLYDELGRPGDRYLLCSDGLTAVVPASGIHQVLRDAAEPEAAVRELIGAANSGGGPDNIACVVADLVEARELAADPPPPRPDRSTRQDD
jgi:serine/threonine protein phosphatase PrpC